MEVDQKVNTDNASRSKYQVIFDRLPNVIFNATAVGFPSMTVGTAPINTPFKTMPFAGTTLEHGPFRMSFILNDDHSNYGEILHWMEGIAFTEKFQQYSDIEKGDGVYSDFTVTVFSNANVPVARYRFTDAFPNTLSDLDFDSQDDTDGPIMVNTSFEFMLFKLEPVGS